MRRPEASPVQAGLDLLVFVFSSLSALRRPNGVAKRPQCHRLVDVPGGQTVVVTKDHNLG